MPSEDEILVFTRMIEKTSLESEIDLLDSICFHCEAEAIEFEVAASLLSQSVKDKIREQAEAMNLIRKESRLPI